MEWFEVVKGENYDPCCEGGKVEFVRLMDRIHNKWPPSDALKEPHAPPNVHELVEELEEYFKGFKDFVLNLTCEQFKYLINKSDAPNVFNPHGKIAQYYITNVRKIGEGVSICEDKETDEDKINYWRPNFSNEFLVDFS